MKAIKTTLAIAKLRSIIAQWKNRKTTDATPLITTSKQCGAFGILKSNVYGMPVCYPPLLHEKFNTNYQPQKSKNRGNSAETFPETFPQNNIYKYISKESSSGEEVSPEGEKLPTSFFSKENFVTTDSLADAKEFFHLTSESEDEQAQILILFSRSMFQLMQFTNRFYKDARIIPSSSSLPTIYPHSDSHSFLQPPSPLPPASP